MPPTHGLLSHGEGCLGVNAPWRLLAHLSLGSSGLSLLRAMETPH